MSRGGIDISSHGRKTYCSRKLRRRGWDYNYSIWRIRISDWGDRLRGPHIVIARITRKSLPRNTDDRWGDANAVVFREMVSPRTHMRLLYRRIVFASLPMLCAHVGYSDTANPPNETDIVDGGMFSLACIGRRFLSQYPHGLVFTCRLFVVGFANGRIRSRCPRRIPPVDLRPILDIPAPPHRF